MAKMWLLVFGLLVALILALVVLVLCLHPDWRYALAERDCAGRAESQDCRIQLALGPIGVSVWDNGATALAISLVNRGRYAAADVRVAVISFGGGKGVKPVGFPIALGEILSGRRAVVQARFENLKVPAAYKLSLSGTYTDKGVTRPFDLEASVEVRKSTGGSFRVSTAILQKFRTPGIAVPPVGIHRRGVANPAGPPIPDGRPIKRFVVAPNSTGAASASSGGSSVDIIRDTGANQAGLFPPDPTAAAGGGVVMASGNTYVLLSTDDGANFTRIDPTTVGFPNDDGGICCDQVVIYDAPANLFFWLIQYSSGPANPPDPAKPGPNRLRIAWATPESIRANPNAWTFVDLQSQVLSTVVNEALDFPDLALTAQHLYVSVDRVTTRSATTGAISVQGLIVARIPLAHVTAGGSTVGVSWFGPEQSSDQNFATGARLTQSSADAMYWGGHVDASTLKVFRWADRSDRVETHDTAVDTWCKTMADYVSLAPDGQQWIDNTRTSANAVIGAAHRRPDAGAQNGEVWLAWGAGKDDGTSTCSQGRPQPFVKIARINDQTLDAIGEYHIWNSTVAFAYPALATNPPGEFGVSVAFGGANDYAATAVGYLGDFVVYYVEPSDTTLTFTQQNSAGMVITDAAGNPVLFTRYGDYFTVRNTGPANVYFSSQQYAVRLNNPALSSNCTTLPGCVFRPHYVQWGRPPIIVQ